MQNDYGPHGFTALAVNLQEDMENVVKIWARQNTNPYLRDNGSVWGVYRQNNYIPLNYIIDTAGVVRFWQEGFNEDYLKQLIEQYLPNQIDHDVGVTRLIAPAGAIDSGTVITPACSVYNYRNNTETYEVRMRIGTAYNQAVTVTAHAPNTARYVEFPQWTALERGQLNAVCSTELAGDDINGNDSRRNLTTVNVYDLAVVAILAPADTLDSAAVIQPAIVVTNLGTMSDYARTRFFIGGFYAESVNVALQPGVTDTAFLPAWTAQELGTFAARCSVSGLRGEMLPANNVLGKTVHVRSSGIAEPPQRGAGFALFEAQPNPAGSRTVLSYALPAASPVDLRVYSSSGGLVRTLRVGVEPAGTHSVRWDGRDDAGSRVGPGTYFCRLSAGSFRAARKLTLVD
ncbi:MAG: FlgD immunoglobulin-like domain containing protein [bacterium]